MVKLMAEERALNEEIMGEDVVPDPDLNGGNGVDG